MEEDKVLNETTWPDEAKAIIKDIQNHVKEISISKTVLNSNQRIYFNLLTFENKEYCVELTGSGFTIVGENFDTTNISTNTYYETPYSLLNNISSAYRQSFGNELINKLNELQDDSN